MFYRLIIFVIDVVHGGIFPKPANEAKISQFLAGPTYRMQCCHEPILAQQKQEDPLILFASQSRQKLPKLIEFSKAFCAAVHREEAMRILKIRLLQKLSRYTGISKLMVPCNSDELAELTIAQLCLGREILCETSPFLYKSRSHSMAW
ncbi:hypothetical protein NECAME_10217 [Necator americanus]|uniref:Uncharacterized protein n=1 Tax=Necator americanus TaxID=51031 RepID=W2TBQ7_NECAM|nr:hypothetical protein NECAME_10217 [Necator americanus]ETN78631.1 hypothetical protein NECAME_10217 [Necator americanus]